ncbi:hypothetical protein GOB83_13755 [Acetobacter fabarum]|uniref:hypothetical protein n=1 Tax=Acetobacter fabarum TaxID=483199 RepID=UPI001405500B|nr:hypothetical protein [Acetobacter fabarum]NHO43219.1 hypothetical protein [Acetobacter fabarum]
MAKFLVSYQFRTTINDLHAVFKKKAEEKKFCEYVFATDINNKSQYCKLPNTTLWCEKKSITSVSDALLDISGRVFDEAVSEGKLSRAEIANARITGGLLENFSVSYISTLQGGNVSLHVKEGTFVGLVDYSASIYDALAHQAAQREQPPPPSLPHAPPRILRVLHQIRGRA